MSALNNEQGFSQGSEPFLRDDEAICPVTGYTYHAALGVSPYIVEPKLITPELQVTPGMCKLSPDDDSATSKFMRLSA